MESRKIKPMVNTKTEDKSAETELKSFWQQQFEEPVTDKAFLAELKEAHPAPISEFFTESNGDKLIQILKSTFLFLPGAFFLFMMSSFTFFLFFDMDMSLFEVARILPWLIVPAFMVMFGMSDVKNPKNLFIPLSIVALGFIAYLVSALFGDGMDPKFLIKYSPYLFPMVLATPFLIKNLLSENNEHLELP